MNVLLSSCTHWWNAEAHYAANLAEELLGHGHQAWVLTQPGTRHAEQLQRRGLPLITDLPLWQGNPLRWPSLLGGLRTLQRRLALDVVDVFRSREFFLHVLAARCPGGPAVVRTRGSARPVRRHAVNRWLYGRGCQAVVTSAQVLRQQLLDGLGLPPQGVRTIYFPAPPPLASSAEALTQRRRAARERLLAETGWDAPRLLLAIVGRAFPEKGHATLLEALALAQPRLPPWGLVILDKRYEDEAPYRHALERRGAELGLQAQVRWLGFRDDLPLLLEGADWGVIPSLASELNCRVAVEFFAAGTPVLAFPTGALPEVVQHGTTGLVAEERSAASLAGLLEQAAAQPALQAILGLAAWSAAGGRFSRARFLHETLEVFQQALAARPRR